MLYQYMPLPDYTDRTEAFYRTYVVQPALQARAEMPWGKTVTDSLFLHFVLPLRVNNEALDHHRPMFYEELKPRVQHLSMTDAILEVNHWCHEKATYEPSDARTHSPLQTVSSGIGRCGEESTFTVAALRSVGIPARQVYTPVWAHTDDNHAWVEAWADGQWHFLGACEPEPVLNLGWFNAPASRGMLMHARVFGHHNDGCEILAQDHGTTTINVTSHYAPTSQLHVKIIDANGRAVPQARVMFYIYNYASLSPIATRITDTDGAAQLEVGIGDVVVWATDGTHYGFCHCRVGTEETIQLVLEYDENSTFEKEFTLTPPMESSQLTAVTGQQRAENDSRMADEDALRAAHLATFAAKHEADYLLAARGNHQTIRKFIEEAGTERSKAIALLTQGLSSKDLTDVTLEVLTDHLTAVDNGSELFVPYILSPRIGHEELTPFRSALRSVLPDSIKEGRCWMEWVRQNINASEKWYPESVTMSPMAVYKLRRTSPQSRDLFFVAGARTLGIPARLNPVTGIPQWHDGNDWQNADFERSMEAEHCNATLKLVYQSTKMLQDPQYLSHFTLSVMEKGIPRLLNYPDFAPWSTLFREAASITAAPHLLLSGRRLASGAVLVRMKMLKAEASSTITDTLRIRHDSTQLEVIGSFDSETLYNPVRSNVPKSLLSQTGRGFYVLGLVRATHEPSNHALRDIVRVQDELRAIGRPMVLLYSSEEELKRADTTLHNEVGEVAMWGTDINATIASGIIEGLKLGQTEFPLFIVADTFNRIVFYSQGYTIGTGETLVKVLKQLEK